MERTQHQVTDTVKRGPGRPKGTTKQVLAEKPTIVASPKPKPAPKPKAAPKKRGRPGWEPTPAIRTEIMRLTSVGITDETLAKRFNVSESVLKQHCAEELAHGRNIARADLSCMLWAAAEKGNVAAMKRLSEMQSAVGAQEDILKDATDHAARAAEARVAPLGKKEQRLIDAAAAGQDSEWGADLGLPN